MIGKAKKSRVAFRLEGCFLGYEIEDGIKIKRLRLSTAEGEQVIKLTQEARATLRGVLVPGDWVEVIGIQKVDGETAKLKADSVRLLTAAPAQPSLSSLPGVAQQKILVCQKSDCMKRGGKAVCQALAQALHDRHLTDRVTVQGTGCMKACSKGPNLVMPGKSRYTRVAAKDMPALVDEYFLSQSDIPKEIEATRQ